MFDRCVVDTCKQRRHKLISTGKQLCAMMSRLVAILANGKRLFSYGNVVRLQTDQDVNDEEWLLHAVSTKNSQSALAFLNKRPAAIVCSCEHLVELYDLSGQDAAAFRDFMLCQTEYMRCRVVECALRCNNTPLLRLFVDLGIFHMSSSRTPYRDSQNLKSTLLHEAVQNAGVAAVVVWFLKNGALEDVNATDAFLRKPIILARTEEIVEILLAAGAIASEYIRHTSGSRWPGLHYAYALSGVEFVSCPVCSPTDCSSKAHRHRSRRCKRFRDRMQHCRNRVVAARVRLLSDDIATLCIGLQALALSTEELLCIVDATLVLAQFCAIYTKMTIICHVRHAQFQS